MSAIISPERRAWLDLMYEIESLGLLLLEVGDAKAAQVCFDLGAEIDRRCGITSAENKALIREALAEAGLTPESLGLRSAL